MNALVSVIEGFLGASIEFDGTRLAITWGDLIAGFVLPLAALFVAIRVLVVFVRRLVERSQLSERGRAIVMRWFRILYRAGFALAVVLLGANLFGDQIIESLQSIIAFLREPFFTAGTTRISVVTIILLLPIFYLATWAGNQTRRVLEHGVLNRLNLDPSRRFSFLSLSRYGVMVLVIVIGLSIVGINLSSLAVIFGVLGLGIGFGLQGVVANFFAGIMIILSQPIKEGDRINIDELEGDVQQIRILYSVVNTISNETLIVPNRQIVESVVHNQSYDDPSIMLRTPVQVSYRSDLDRVKSVLLAVADRSSYRLHEKDPRVVFRSFDDSGITVILVIPIANAKDRHLARSEAIMEIWRAFRQNGIEIPFPQMDLHVKDLPARDGAPEGAIEG